MKNSNIQQIIIYGAGIIGNRNYEFLKKNALEHCVYAFCDKNYENIKEIEGIPVISYESAKALGKTFILSVKREKEDIIEEFENDNVAYYSNFREWIKGQFEGQECAYLMFLYENQNVKDEPFEVFGNLDEELFEKLRENLLGVKKICGGYCSCCESDTLFVAKKEWLRDGYKCMICNSIPRQRAIMKILNDIRPNWQNLKIHECSPSGSTMRLMQKKCSDYTYSYFYETLPLGKKLDDNSTNQNIECMTFANESFDIYITQDVFEHINHPYSALKEIARVLKPGGIHIFTVPLYPFTKSRPRICVKEGGIEHILPPIWHRNPISEEGSLVTFDWGSDVTEIMEQVSGMKTEIYSFPQSAECVRLGLEADYLHVLVSYKENKNTV